MSMLISLALHHFLMVNHVLQSLDVKLPCRLLLQLVMQEEMMVAEISIRHPEEIQMLGDPMPEILAADQIMVMSLVTISTRHGIINGIQETT